MATSPPVEPWPPPRDWSDQVDWWESPASAYIKGLQDGVTLFLDAEALRDDTVWRKTVREFVRAMDRPGATDRGRPGAV